jgi:hypothetical protein
MRPPFVWLLTLYLLIPSERPAAATPSSPAWGWIKLVALAGAAVLLVLTVVVNVAGRQPSGAVATTQRSLFRCPDWTTAIPHYWGDQYWGDQR